MNDYVLPTAMYEMAAITWVECCNPPSDMETDKFEYRRMKVEECQGYLETVKGWESFVLDARIGMRVQSGLETIGWLRHKMGWE